jgi:hypothetical protein
MQETQICELHGTQMVKMEVPLGYGLPPYDPASEVARDLFPNARTLMNGGCMIDLEGPTSVDMFVCADCRKAEEEWRKANNAERITFGNRLAELFRAAADKS